MQNSSTQSFPFTTFLILGLVVTWTANAAIAGVIVNATFTDSAVQTWDNVQKAVVNRAIANWTQSFAGIDDGVGGVQSVAIDLEFDFESVPFLSYSEYDFSAAAQGDNLRPWNATTKTTVHFTVAPFLGSTMWWDETPGDDGSDIPAGRWDALSVALHEIGHALGFVDLFVDNYQLANQVSPWEECIVNDIFDPTGLSVPMRPGDSSHLRDSSFTMGALLQKGIRLPVSDLEIAMLAKAYEYRLMSIPEPSTLWIFMAIAVPFISHSRSRSFPISASPVQCIPWQ